MNHLGYEVEDFLMDEGFCNYCLRKDPADVAFWEDWLEKHPEKKPLAEQAEAFYLVLNGNLSGIEFERNYREFAKTIDQHIVQSGLYSDSSRTTGRPSRKNVRYIVGIGSAAAAVIVGLIVGGGWFFSRSVKPVLQAERVPRQGLVEQMNTGSISKTLVLEDGSTVKLSPGAMIEFPQHFPADRREIYLKGQAYFDVVKNSGRPFFVYDSSIVTEVLGTTFTIRPVNGRIEVSVHSGRVAVFENGHRSTLSASGGGEDGVIVTPNQRVTFFEEERHFITSLLDSPVAYNITGRAADSTFIFDDAPLSQVLHRLEKSFGIEIVLENDDLSKCPFTGNISKQTLYKKLDLVTAAFQASYEIKGTRILVKGGRGCH